MNFQFSGDTDAKKASTFEKTYFRFWHQVKKTVGQHGTSRVDWKRFSENQYFLIIRQFPEWISYFLNEKLSMSNLMLMFLIIERKLFLSQLNSFITKINIPARKPLGWEEEDSLLPSFTQGDFQMFVNSFHKTIFTLSERRKITSLLVALSYPGGNLVLSCKDFL